MFLKIAFVTGPFISDHFPLADVMFINNEAEQQTHGRKSQFCDRGGTSVSIRPHYCTLPQIKEEMATDASLVATNYHQYHSTALSSISLSLERQKYLSMLNQEINAFLSLGTIGLLVIFVAE